MNTKHFFDFLRPGIIDFSNQEEIDSFIADLLASYPTLSEKISIPIKDELPFSLEKATVIDSLPRIVSDRINTIFCLSFNCSIDGEIVIADRLLEYFSFNVYEGNRIVKNGSKLTFFHYSYNDILKENNDSEIIEVANEVKNKKVMLENLLEGRKEEFTCFVNTILRKELENELQRKQRLENLVNSSTDKFKDALS